MENRTKPLKEVFLDSAVGILFEDLVKLHRKGQLPSRISLVGLDTTSLTRAFIDLGCKLKRHGVLVFPQKADDSAVVDLRGYYGRALARHWCHPDYTFETGAYVVARGFDSQVREGFAQELEALAKIPVYSEPQFPESLQKITVDLEEFASSQSAI